MSLVSTDWLMTNLNKVKIIDCSWHMPQTKRNGFEEYNKQHIKNAIFFDLDKNSKKDTDLPHMLIDIKSWKNIVSNMGIKNAELETAMNEEIEKVRTTLMSDEEYKKLMNQDLEEEGGSTRSKNIQICRFVTVCSDCGPPKMSYIKKTVLGRAT